jgi:hypothetical protein
MGLQLALGYWLSNYVNVWFQTNSFWLETAGRA